MLTWPVPPLSLGAILNLTSGRTWSSNQDQIVAADVAEFTLLICAAWCILCGQGIDLAPHSEENAVDHPVSREQIYFVRKQAVVCLADCRRRLGRPLRAS